MKTEKQIIRDCIILIKKMKINDKNLNEDFVFGMQHMKIQILKSLENKQKIDKMRYD